MQWAQGSAKKVRCLSYLPDIEALSSFILCYIFLMKWYFPD